MTEKTQTRLQSEAMLVTLSLKHWDGIAMDREVTAQVTQAAGAKSDAARVTKRLVNRSTLRPIHQATDRIREQFIKLSLPWNDNGQRLLPIATHKRFVEEMDKLIDARTAAVDQFLEGYAGAIEEAKNELGSLWKETDYPDATDIREKVSAQYEFLPVPDGSHFVADMAEEERERIKRQIETARPAQGPRRDGRHLRAPGGHGPARGRPAGPRRRRERQAVPRLAP